MRRALPLLLLMSLALPASGQTIDRIAAVVERQVITLSELNQMLALRFFAQNSGESTDAYRRRVLDSMIVQLLRYRDVERFGAQDVSKDAIEARLTEISKRFSSREEFEATVARLELSLDEVRALVKRQLQVEAYIDERFSPLIFVSLDEIEKYYRETWTVQRRERGLPVSPLPDVREEIRDLLRAARLQVEIEKWTTQLRSRANVDILAYE
jgi:peptidyl-prolyl cis-trans isomerase SurA